LPKEVSLKLWILMLTWQPRNDDITHCPPPVRHPAAAPSGGFYTFSYKPTTVASRGKSITKRQSLGTYAAFKKFAEYDKACRPLKHFAATLDQRRRTTLRYILTARRDPQSRRHGVSHPQSRDSGYAPWEETRSRACTPCRKESALSYKYSRS
jgi:hypothetical protein